MRDGSLTEISSETLRARAARCRRSQKARWWKAYAPHWRVWLTNMKIWRPAENWREALTGDTPCPDQDRGSIMSCDRCEDFFADPWGIARSNTRLGGWHTPRLSRAKETLQADSRMPD